MLKNIRTDLAIESRPPHVEQGADDGVMTRETEQSGFKLTETEIFKGRGEEITGRAAGLYISLDTGKLWLEDNARRRSAAAVLSGLITRLMPGDKEGGVLVAGLGNEDISADSIGPKTVGRLVVTHHLKRLNPSLYEGLGFGDMAAVVPSVLGKTGVESRTLIKAAADCVKPACVIVVDALAARSLHRLATTVQLTCVGISPGSGVCNSREEISEKTVGCPVIAIGVPTVVDVPTLLWEAGGTPDEVAKGFFVAPKESDVMTRVMAELIAAAINSAVHVNTEDLDEYAPL